jgi:diadenosine tetraphosphate (Ap4A) HIT family hydrolase
VILNRHAREMGDLGEGERNGRIAVVFAFEAAVRETMQAHKMNLASLGNAVPHVHWHVIPRFEDDRHYPGPIWAVPKREGRMPPERVKRAEALAAALTERLGK